jgi:hypothetical protein
MRLYIRNNESFLNSYRFFIANKKQSYNTLQLLSLSSMYTYIHTIHVVLLLQSTQVLSVVINVLISFRRFVFHLHFIKPFFIVKSSYSIIHSQRESSCLHTGNDRND